MNIEITQETLDEVNYFMNNGFVPFLSDKGLSFPALAFILQSLITAIDEAQAILDED